MSLPRSQPEAVDANLRLIKAIADDCRKARDEYAKMNGRAINSDSVADIYRRIAENLDAALASARCSKGSEGADAVDFISRKEIVEYLKSENCPQELVDIVDNFPPAPDAPATREGDVEAIARIIDPVAFDAISLNDKHPSWACRRERATDTAKKIAALAPASGAIPATVKLPDAELLYRMISVADIDPGDGTARPNFEEVLAKGFYAMGYAQPSLAAYEMIYSAAERIETALTAEYELATPPHYRPDAADEEDCPKALPQTAREQVLADALRWALEYVEGYDHGACGPAPADTFQRDYDEKTETVRILLGVERAWPRWKLKDHFGASALSRPERGGQS